MGFSISQTIGRVAGAARGATREAANNVDDLGDVVANPKTRSLAKSMAVRGGIGAASVVAGYTGAHFISDRGDYNHNRSWMMGAALASSTVGAVGTVLVTKGRAKSMGSLDTLAQKAAVLDEKFQMMDPSLEAAKTATGAGKTAAVKAVAEQHAQLKQANEELLAAARSAGGEVRAGHNMSEATNFLVGGAAAGIMVTSTNLDPGIMHWVGELTVKDESDSGLEKNVKTVGEGAKGVGGVVKDGAGKVKDLGGAINPFD